MFVLICGSVGLICLMIIGVILAAFLGAIVFNTEYGKAIGFALLFLAFIVIWTNNVIIPLAHQIPGFYPPGH